MYGRVKVKMQKTLVETIAETVVETGGLGQLEAGD